MESQVRRLAAQSREDVYATRRDYQTIHDRISQKISFQPGSASESLNFKCVGPSSPDSKFTAFGGYINPDTGVKLRVTLSVGGTEATIERSLTGRVWNRVGVCVEAARSTDICISFWLEVSVAFSFWGLDAGPVLLPPSIAKQNVSLADLNGSSLAPETFYLPHQVATSLELDPETSSRIFLAEGASISLKKCSYCGRLLPIDPSRLGALAFHKHNAKRTNHQNECRACKKWKINNSFNPLRTVDQLNESSLITRERKLLLRETQIIQEIKERTGAGLKSQVWKRFGRKCFLCGKLLKLSEVQLDHTRPLAYLWPIDVHATCLCGEDNNLKKDKFPADFYSMDQLIRLSSICGLPLETLRKKEVNEVELARIIDDIERFAKEWEPRTFMAVARKVKEVKPSVDLFEILNEASPAAEAELREQLADRPPSVGDSEEDGEEDD